MSVTEYEIQMNSREKTIVKINIICNPKAIRPYGFYAEMRDQDGEILDCNTNEELFVTKEEAIAELNLMAEFKVTPCTLCDIF